MVKIISKPSLTLFWQSTVTEYYQRRTASSPTSKAKDNYSVSQFQHLSKTRNPLPFLFRPCPVSSFKETSLTEAPHLLNLHLSWCLKYTAWKGNSFKSHQMAFHGGLEGWECCWNGYLLLDKLLVSPRALSSLCCMVASYLHFACAVPDPHHRNDNPR